MKFKIAFLAFFLFCNLTASTYQEYQKRWQLVDKESAAADSLKEEINKNYPASKLSFEFCQTEFYDKLYPIWRNDSLKIVVIAELLEKYPQNQWARTMYRYWAHSLFALEKYERLQQVLFDFRKDFPEDYKPWQLAAHYYLEMGKLGTALEFAEQGYQLSKNYPTLHHFPPQQWNLEKRAASVEAAENYAKALFENNEYDKAIQLLEAEINNNKLGMEDEKTTAGLHYLLAKNYYELSREGLAVKHALKALKKGDRTNLYASKAERLLTKHTGLKGVELLEFARQNMNYKGIRFSNITTQANLHNVKAKRVAWADYNQDGFDDILVNGNRIFQNKEGKKFIEVTDSVFRTPPASNGGLWADLNNDGFLDIITKDPEQIYVQKEGKFQLLANLDNQVSTEGMAVGDVNNDGWLDIYLANYENRQNEETTYIPDEFYVNREGRKFYEATGRAGLYNSRSFAGRGVNMCDFDRDGDLDIYVSNYRLNPNFLWENDGSGHFQNRADKYDLAGAETEGWWGHTIGSQWADYDSDGDWDLITCNLAHPRYIDFSNKTMLYQNNKLEYKDVRAQTGIKFSETHSEPCWADFNNDGYLDLYITSVYPKRRSFLYLNNGDGTFRDVTYLSGARYFNGWGVASSDFDNDGNIDLLVAGKDLVLYKNETQTKNHWVEFKIYGKKHSDAIGTTIILKHSNLTQIRQIQGGKGTTNQNSLTQHFGLKFPVKSTRIIFPDGTKKIFKNIKPNIIYEIYE